MKNSKLLKFTIAIITTLSFGATTNAYTATQKCVKAKAKWWKNINQASTELERYKNKPSIRKKNKIIILYIVAHKLDSESGDLSKECGGLDSEMRRVKRELYPKIKNIIYGNKPEQSMQSTIDFKLPTPTKNAFEAITIGTSCEELKKIYDTDFENTASDYASFIEGVERKRTALYTAKRKNCGLDDLEMSDKMMVIDNDLTLTVEQFLIEYDPVPAPAPKVAKPNYIPPFPSKPGLATTCTDFASVADDNAWKFGYEYFIQNAKDAKKAFVMQYNNCLDTTDTETEKKFIGKLPLYTKKIRMTKEEFNEKYKTSAPSKVVFGTTCKELNKIVYDNKQNITGKDYENFIQKTKDAKKAFVAQYNNCSDTPYKISDEDFMKVLSHYNKKLKMTKIEFEIEFSEMRKTTKDKEQMPQ